MGVQLSVTCHSIREMGEHRANRVGITDNMRWMLYHNHPTAVEVHVVEEEYSWVALLGSLVGNCYSALPHYNAYFGTQAVGDYYKHYYKLLQCGVFVADPALYRERLSCLLSMVHW